MRFLFEHSHVLQHVGRSPKESVGRFNALTTGTTVKTGWCIFVAPPPRPKRRGNAKPSRVGQRRLEKSVPTPRTDGAEEITAAPSVRNRSSHSQKLRIWL